MRNSLSPLFGACFSLWLLWGPLLLGMNGLAAGENLDLGGYSTASVAAQQVVAAEIIELTPGINARVWRRSVIANNLDEAEAILRETEQIAVRMAYDEVYASAAFYGRRGGAAVNERLGDIAIDVVEFAPRLAANQVTKLTDGLVEVLQNIPNAAQRETFLRAMNRLDELGHYDNFLLDLGGENGAALRVAFGEDVGLVGAWEATGGSRIAADVPTLTRIANQINGHPAKLNDFILKFGAADDLGKQQLTNELEWFFGFKPGYFKEDIATLAKADRPENPATYLTNAYINQHLPNFHGNASYLVTGNTYLNFIESAPFVGRPDGLFISTTSYIDEVLNSAGGNVALVEELMGIPAGWWQNQGGIYRINISAPENFNLRIPNGREVGANDLWLPGGRTSGGVLEAVTNQIPQINITAIRVIDP